MRHRETRILASAGSLLLGAMSPSAGAEEAQASAPSKGAQPAVVAKYPGYFSQQVIAVNSIIVEFHAPVAGVEAGALRVNGSPATRVAGQGAGAALRLKRHYEQGRGWYAGPEDGKGP